MFNGESGILIISIPIHSLRFDCLPTCVHEQHFMMLFCHYTNRLVEKCPINTQTSQKSIYSEGIFFR